MSDLHEAYLSVKARLDHLGIDSDNINFDEIEQPNDDVTEWTVVLSSNDD